MMDMTETVKRISGVNPRKCMKCGKCTAACPAYGEMEYHPHQFVDMVETGRVEELMALRLPGAVPPQRGARQAH